MFEFIVGLIVFLAIILVLAILAQNAKGGGLSSQFGGSGASNMFGVKKTGDFLEKATWGIAITIIVLALATNLNFVTPSRTAPTNEIFEKAGEEAPTGTQNISPPTEVQPADDDSI